MTIYNYERIYGFLIILTLISSNKVELLLKFTNLIGAIHFQPSNLLFMSTDEQIIGKVEGAYYKTALSYVQGADTIENQFFLSVLNIFLQFKRSWNNQHQLTYFRKVSS